MDGIDACIINISNNKLLHSITYPYSNQLKKKLAIPFKTIPELYELNSLVGREFARAANCLLQAASIKHSAIKAIGSHGQTVCHNPFEPIPYTIQLGCAHTIAEITGIPVVADFRTRDLIAGGQGAPLAPLFHQELFRHQPKPLAVINIGGIANLTYLHDNGISGYDTGPGNCLMDAWIKHHKNQDYDANGAWAKSGRINCSLLNKLLEDAYFSKNTPKSIGKEYFSLPWLAHYLSSSDSIEDVQATLLQLTVVSIYNNLRNLPLFPKKVLICGGGAHNDWLIASLSNLLPNVACSSTSEISINPDFIEAHLFAWLANKTLNNEPVILKNITGSTRPVVLGVIYPAGIDKRNSLEV